MTITKSRAQSRAFWIIGRDASGFTKRRLVAKDYAQLMGWDKKSQQQYLGINRFHRPSNANLKGAKLKGLDYGSALSQTQLLGALGNSFSVPVFEAIAENVLKCFSGQKVNSDSEASDSDSDSMPGLVSDSDELCEQCSDGDKGSVDLPVKKPKLSQYRVSKGLGPAWL